MGDLDDILEPDAAHGGDRFGAPALMLAPAVLRIVILGRDMDAELDALVAAVAILQGSDGFMRNFVYEMAAELAKTVEASGTRGLADSAKTGLDSDQATMAVQIALLAVFSSPRGGDDDIGVLSAIAERIGVSEDDFAGAYESARRAVTDR